ncbi:Holliday junction resolvase [Azospirillum brasilense]|uniref:Holliday junction resolvase n=1 Tax=Azospirillum brasilense TaxID=192 RepID=UPI00157B63D6|nr:Holliday junction resolvase [Azospirillum brasilense]
MAGGVLALDLATNTGWTLGRLPMQPLLPMQARVQKPPKPLSGAIRFGRPGCTIGAFADAAEAWGRDFMEKHRPTGLIYEKPILPQDTTPDTILKLNGLALIFLMLAHRFGIRWVRTAQPSTVKKHFCGSGGPGKEGVQAECLARGWTFATDDEADALALWDYAATLAANERAAA